MGLSAEGEPGLIQLPSAFFSEEPWVGGGYAWGGERYRRDYLAAHPFEGVAFSFLRRDAEPLDPGLAGEASANLRLRFWPETAWRPALAVGLRDLEGGRYGAEYLVLGKRWRNWDFTFGLGWGRLGETAHIRNPLGFLGPAFREPRDQSGLRSGPQAWFTGPDVAFFGGAAWHTPVEGLALQIEYDPTRRIDERGGDPSVTGSIPLNMGVSYRPWSWIGFGAAWERGDTVSLRVALSAQPEALDGLAPVYPPPPPVLPRWRKLANDSLGSLGHSFATTGLTAVPGSISPDGTSVDLDLAGHSGGAMPTGQAIGRAARLLAAWADPHAETVTVKTRTRGLEGPAVTLLRADLERAASYRGSPEEILTNAQIGTGAGAEPGGAKPGGSGVRFAVTPRFEQTLSDAFGTYLYRATTDVAADWEVEPGLILGATARINLASNLERLNGGFLFTETPVRSDIALYAQSSVFWPEKLYAAWLWDPLPELDTRLALGQFEEMYGGVGAELLYRPYARRWALGSDLNLVWKRPFNDPIRLLAGSGRLTGHGSVYYEGPGAHWTSALHLGRYLGGDMGGTLELARVWDRGVRLLASVTWTVGGAFVTAGTPDDLQRVDAGLTLSIPIGRITTLPRSSQVEIVTGNLGRDTGQRLDRPLPLYETTLPATYGTIIGSWDRILD